MKKDQVYLPDMPIDSGDELIHDPETYDMLHIFTTPWPCLSFSIIKDSLQNESRDYPHTLSIIAGTQASKPNKNAIYLIKCQGLCKTRKNDENNDIEPKATKPSISMATIPHKGGVNRIRSFQPNLDTLLAAAWVDTGQVHIWNASIAFSSLNTAIGNRNGIFSESPLYTLREHKKEGFGIAWSSQGRLLTGDMNGSIILSNPNSTNWKPSNSFKAHSKSIEDIQWSRIEQNVFASSSSDQTFKIWDIRDTSNPVVSVHASNSDINVLDWNPLVHYLMAIGCDDGSFSAYDLRFIKQENPKPLSHFSWHREAITSIEWHPSDSSTLVVSGSDNQTSLWDLSLERDVEQPIDKDDNIPPQLLFIHQGQKDIKESHWHNQIPGTIISTSYSGFNIFKTFNV